LDDRLLPERLRLLKRNFFIKYKIILLTFHPVLMKNHDHYVSNFDYGFLNLI
jgi:hypothetical protein